MNLRRQRYAITALGASDSMKIKKLKRVQNRWMAIQNSAAKVRKIVMISSLACVLLLSIP